MIIGRRLRSRISVVRYIFVVYGMAALVLVMVMLAARQAPFAYPPIAFLWFALLALVPQLLGHSSFNWALGYLSAAFVSLTLLGEPIGSTILAYFLLNEKPPGMKVFGAILILAGILVASRSEKAE
jgi:drug/metabolite transporter (DMT)-like permease